MLLLCERATEQHVCRRQDMSTANLKTEQILTQGVHIVLHADIDAFFVQVRCSFQGPLTRGFEQGATLPSAVDIAMVSKLAANLDEKGTLPHVLNLSCIC